MVEAEQEAAEEQAAGVAEQEQELELAVAVQGLEPAEAVQGLELAVAVQGLEPAEAVQEPVAGEAVVGLAEDRAEDPAGELAAELAKELHLEDGRLHRRCFAEPRADWAACQAFLAQPEKAAAVVFRWRKRMFGRCLDCSRNWGSPAKIRMRGWMRRPSNPA